VSRVRDYLKRAGRKGKVLAGRATIVAGQVTGYVVPVAAGYFGGPWGVAAGSAAGAGGALLEASGRNLAGKKRQNVRVKVQQGAVRGLVLGAAGYGARTAVDYLTQAQSTVGTNSPTTATIRGTDVGAKAEAASGSKASTLSATKAGSVVEFDTSTGTATVKAATPSLLDKAGPYASTIAGLSGLLLSPGGSGQIPAPGTWGDFGLTYGGDPGAVSGAPDEAAPFAFSPVVLIVLAVLAFFMLAKK
jgi:hypothetical protein